MYSIKKVSELLDIPQVTLRAWENRYQIINPIRNNGGHRRYTEEDINTLKEIKSLMAKNNLKVSEAAVLFKQSTQTDDQSVREVSFTGKTVQKDIVEKLYKNLIELKAEQSHKTIDLSFSLYDYNDVLHNILTPVLYRIGDEWEKGIITVAQEHFASELIMQRCSKLLGSLRPQLYLPKVLAFCPEGEHHQMGLMLFSLFLRSKGLDVIYLGPNTPLQDLHRLIGDQNISIITISVSNYRFIKILEEWLEDVKHKFIHLKIILGGSGFLNHKTSLFSHLLSGKLSDWEEWYQANILR